MVVSPPLTAVSVGHGVVLLIGGRRLHGIIPSRAPSLSQESSLRRAEIQASSFRVSKCFPPLPTRNAQLDVNIFVGLSLQTWHMVVSPFWTLFIE